MHVRNAKLGFDAAVNEFHHRMHNTLRVNDDVDGGIGDVEEEVCLDHFEALVHHRCRIYSDLRSHLPARMGKCLGNRHALQCFERTAQEWTAGSSQNQTADGSLLLAPQTL